jgi:hypothetical protein
LTADFEKHRIGDFGQKLAHLEGILGAYLPSHVFDSEEQKRAIQCDKFAFSRLKSGKRMAANHELGRFIEIFDLARHGFDYRLFLLPFDEFDRALGQAGVGSYGTTAAERLRERLRSLVDRSAEIAIRRDRPLNVGGIGYSAPETGPMILSPRDKVRLTVPLAPVSTEVRHVLLLHDFPAHRAMSCLVPSVFAPDPVGAGATLRLPQDTSGYLAFPVGGLPGYRCLYAIQSGLDLGDYIGLSESDATVPDVTAAQIALLLDVVTRLSDERHDALRITFGEYLLK